MRRGAFVEPGAVLMPSYVNIGARVGRGTMIDTWATVGSGAQVGRDVHVAGGVGIGGVLEPPGATPVIVEDGAFLGSRVIVTEGVRIGREAVLGAGVVLTASTRIIDVTGEQPQESQGAVPAGAVVIPGTRPKQFPAGEYGVPCALVIGQPLGLDRPQDVAQRGPARLRRDGVSAPSAEALAALAYELVAVPSVTGEERALADLVEARCRALPGDRRRAARRVR